MERIAQFEMRNPVIDRNYLKLYGFYCRSIWGKSGDLNIDSIIPHGQIPAIVSQMQEFGIGGFTISAQSDGLLDMVMEFCKCGCMVMGMKETTVMDSLTDSILTRPALVLAIQY